MTCQDVGLPFTAEKLGVNGDEYPAPRVLLGLSSAVVLVDMFLDMSHHIRKHIGREGWEISTKSTHLITNHKKGKSTEPLRRGFLSQSGFFLLQSAVGSV